MNVKIEIAGSVARVTIDNEENTITAAIDGEQQSINEAVRIAATEAPRPPARIHDEEQRVRLLVGQIDDLTQRSRILISQRDALGDRCAALEKQLDDERCEADEAERSTKSRAKADTDRHLATIARMQPLCDAAQRASNAWREHKPDVFAPLTSPEVAVFCDLSTVEAAYEQACAEAADADLPF